MTTGAPKTDVTVLILSSAGANKVLVMRSQNRQKTAPPRKLAGIIKTVLSMTESSYSQSFCYGFMRGFSTRFRYSTVMLSEIVKNTQNKLNKTIPH